MYKLNFKKRVWIVKQYLNKVPTSKIALCQNISRMSVSNIIRDYNQYGWDGLKDHKTGRSPNVLNQTAVIIILDLRKRFGYGACHIEQILKQKGFKISHRQIEKVLLQNNLVVPNIKKQRPRKWVRYELPNPNDLWHTDWSYDPFSGKQLAMFIDDKTHLIVSCGIFDRATAENTIALLYEGIDRCGKPLAIMTDHGGQYYANHPNADQQNTLFGSTLNLLGIKHYLARVNRPQTNGKVERFFLSYKTEFATGAFTNVKDYVQHYNEKRLHMSLNYRTPKEVWDELM
ncbi:MAG: DDE-type integrase/transposase/recombinase [Candidatus Woesearchaeota archaeon]